MVLLAVTTLSHVVEQDNMICDKYQTLAAVASKPNHIIDKTEKASASQGRNL